MRFAIPITSETQEFIGTFLNNGVVPEIDDHGSMFVLTDNPDIPADIIPATDDMWRANDFQFNFLIIPVWVFKQ